MTLSCSPIREGLPRFRDKFPLIAGGMQCEFQNTEGIAIFRFAGRLDLTEGSVRLSTRSHNERSNPLCSIEPPSRIQGCKPLVIMIMAGQHKIDTRRIEHLPDRAHAVVITMLS